MQKIYKNLILITTLMLLTLGLISCASNPKKDWREIKPAAVDLESVYFPAPPDVEGVVITPLDENKKVVTAPKIPIESVILPYSFWKQIIDYIVKTETAVTALHKAANPP